MSLTKFQVFSTVVDLGSLTKAAEALGFTQSAVSHAISSLEGEWGFSLLARGRSGVSLTSNGERMLGYVREMLRWHEQMTQEVAAIKGIEVGTVRIGTFTSVSAQWLPGILQQFERDHPSIELRLLEGDYDEIVHWIGSGAVDFGFLSMPTAQSFEFLPLKKDKLLCIVPDEHACAKQQSISFAQMEEQPFIMPRWGSEHDVWRLLKDNRTTLATKYEVADDQAIMAMVKNGLGISILPEMVLFGFREPLSSLPIEGDHFRTIGIAMPSLKQISPAARMFISCVKNWLRMQGLLDFQE